VAASIDELIAEATALVDRRGGDSVTLALVREDLADAVADCADADVVDDGCAVLVALDRALRAHERSRRYPLAS
jgi:hypothetical protein